jgi:hypothetical protein
MSCVIKRFPKVKICIGDLRTKINLANREAVGQAPDDWDSSGVTFTTYASEWCAISTTAGVFAGVARFNNTSIDPHATHMFYIRHRSDWRNIEAGNVFVLMSDRRFRVLRVDNQDEDNIFDIIQATERGESEAGQA